jgi:hypothetical protein
MPLLCNDAGINDSVLQVLLVEEDDGEVTKQYIKEGDTSVIFNLMKHILSALMRFDPPSMVNVIQERLFLLVKSR